MKMKITLVDRSMYLKALLLLACRDGKIHEKEKTIIMHLGEILGFEKKFCQNTMADALSNRHIIAEAPSFSSPDVAKCFIRDGIRLAFADGQIHPKEYAWLKKIAEQNGIKETWYEDALKAILAQSEEKPIRGLEAEHFVIND